MAIKRVRCIKFTDSYDNNPLTKHDEHTELSDNISTTYGEQLKDNFITEGERQISGIQSNREKNLIFS